jgi:hypothetical protein
MTKHDYDTGYRVGMQKMRDLAQDSIDEMVMKSNTSAQTYTKPVLMRWKRLCLTWWAFSQQTTCF